jgi:hypothetical protein
VRVAVRALAVRVIAVFVLAVVVVAAVSLAAVVLESAARLVATHRHQRSLDQGHDVRLRRTALLLTILSHACNYTFTCNGT